ncbi:MAG: chemotaxis protein CheD [Thermodesulfobacteria bacterium]|nr:chemotaxis protein CheD [Thermodesulfobacteriota bacterium]
MKVEKGRFLILKNQKETLETEALGACVALAARAPEKKIAGLWIFVLPAEKILNSRVGDVPQTFFAAEGIDVFLEALEEAGAEKEELEFFAAGGARFLEAPTVFDLGGLNASMLRKLLKDRGLTLKAEACGRPFPCRLAVDGKEALVTVKISGEEEETW